MEASIAAISSVAGATASAAATPATATTATTSIRRAAERAGLETVAVSPQTRYLRDVLEGSPLVAEFSAPDRLADRLALKTLLMPGGLGSTHTVLVFAKR